MPLSRFAACLQMHIRAKLLLPVRRVQDEPSRMVGHCIFHPSLQPGQLKGEARLHSAYTRSRIADRLGPPNFMAVSMPHQTLPLLPEPNQPYIGGPLMYPSITRDGRIVASARLKSARPRRVAIATYSVAEKRWTEYAEGDYAGSVAISPDGSKLAFAGEASSHPAPLNMIDLKTVKRAPVLMLSLGS